MLQHRQCGGFTGVVSDSGNHRHSTISDCHDVARLFSHLLEVEQDEGKM